MRSRLSRRPWRSTPRMTFDLAVPQTNKGHPKVTFICLVEPGGVGRSCASMRSRHSRRPWRSTPRMTFNLAVPQRKRPLSFSVKDVR